MRTMHLFAGVGGGLLADLILGHTPIIAVEWDKYCCQVLRERAADGWFPELSVWEGDVRLFDPSEYAGVVDCIHAGFPCQDISVAGNQAGLGEGTRSGLYREVLRIAGIVKPRQIFLENVSAILSNGLGTVLADLASFGYDSRWICLRASEVGAPHSRDRWWCLATNPNSRGRGLEGCFKNRNNGKETVAGVKGAPWSAFKLDANVPDSISKRQQRQRESFNAVNSATAENGEAINVINGCESGFWSTESNVGRVANGVPHRVHKLKGLGNAQCPLQAAVAWRLLGGE